jgi:hypothetical protein
MQQCGSKQCGSGVGSQYSWLATDRNVIAHIRMITPKYLIMDDPRILRDNDQRIRLCKTKGQLNPTARRTI